jgi:hypothetical protein
MAESDRGLEELFGELSQDNFVVSFHTVGGEGALVGWDAETQSASL